MFSKADVYQQELARVQKRIEKIERDLKSPAIVYNSYDYTKDNVKLIVLRELEAFLWEKL